MSLLLKSELRLRVGPRHCQIAHWRAGLASRPASTRFVSGAPETLIDEALDALDDGQSVLPQKACVQVEDEHLFMAMLPVQGNWRTAQTQAQRYFDEVLGPEPLLVDVTLAPCGTLWVAAAVYAEQIEAWRHSLAERDVTLTRVSLALLDDLQALRREVTLQDGLLVLVRSEGVSFVTLQAGGVTDVVWERCDLDDIDALVARVQSHLAALAPDASAPETPQPGVCLVPLRAFQTQTLQQSASQLGWQVTPALLADEE